MHARPQQQPSSRLAPRPKTGYIPHMTQDPSPSTIHSFQQSLHDWFSLHQRPLPWRLDYRPYAVWISEIMLQQTQMERGVSYFTRWMQRFPDIAAVAQASEEDILHQWEGLGYYSRARNLHKAARIIIDEHGGVFPTDLAAIRALPGIGPYTAGAIASIAFGADTACIDANVERVLARVFDIDTPLKQEPAASRVRALAALLLPLGKARAHNQAMMELGALVCRKKAHCEACPVQNLCESRHLGIIHERPVAGKRANITQLLVVTGILRCQDKYFMQKRIDTGVWGKLWEFPGGRIEANESPEQAIVREFMEETGLAVRVTDNLGIIRHGYTSYKIHLHCFALELADGPSATARSLPPVPPVLTAASQYRWLQTCDMTQLAMPAAHRKLADAVFGDYGLPL